MKLDVTSFRYITRDEFRVLTAVEMGMRNHELVPVPLIESIARLNRGGTFKIIQVLLRHKLLAHDGKKYDGYRLTYHGFDFLAIRALAMRGSIVGVGRRLGVGKESDVHYCQGPNGEVLALKLHRLGRISFRAIKRTRDYLKHREHASWMFMARLAAAKEFAYMKALKDEGFPVPTPIDQNRHCVVMSYVRAVPLYHIRELNHPAQVLERLMRLLVRLARAGIVHGDFNEFNLMIDEDEKVTLIDFPQIVHMNHANAQEYFERDVKSICDFFRRRIGLEVAEYPHFHEVLAETTEAGAGPLSQPLALGLGRDDDAMLVAAHDASRLAISEGEAREQAASGSDTDSMDSEEAGNEPDTHMPAATGAEGFEGLLPEGGRAGLGEEDELPAEGAEGAEGADCSAAEGAAAQRGAASAPQDGAHNASDSNGEGSESESEDSQAPGQVNISSGRHVRRRQTVKDVRRNLQRQQKPRPGRANNSKVKETRRAKHEIREYLG